MTTAFLLWSVLFGSIGFGFFIYARRQRVIMPFVSGVALMMVPYFVSTSLALVAVSVPLVALPFLVRM